MISILPEGRHILIEPVRCLAILKQLVGRTARSVSSVVPRPSLVTQDNAKKEQG